MIPVDDQSPNKRNRWLSIRKKKLTKQPSNSLLKLAKQLKEKKAQADENNLHANAVDLNAVFAHKKQKRIAPIKEQMMRGLTVDFEKKFKREKDVVFVKKAVQEDLHLCHGALNKLDPHAKELYA